MEAMAVAAISSAHSLSSKFSSPAAKIYFSPTAIRVSSPLFSALKYKSSSLRSRPSSTTFCYPAETLGTDEERNTKCQHGLVFEVGPTDSWDGREVGSPVVKRYISDGNERWLMWYHGAAGSADADTGKNSCSIGLAVSNNGVHWEREVQVMGRSEDWWTFDTRSVSPSEVLIMSSDKLRPPGGGAVYWLYYTGCAPEETAVLPISSRPMPGLAISQDGRHWARIEGDHHTGALFDVGADGHWDSLFIAAPKVVYHSTGDLRMYYHSWDPISRSYAIGLARSRDGIKWMKLGRVLAAGPVGCFDEGGVKNGHVVRMGNGRGYLMAYDGVSAEGVSSIGLAVSSDGLKDWKRCGEKAVLEPSAGAEDGWDSKGVEAPCLVRIDGDGEDEWRLYYQGTGRDGRTGIGLAVSQGSNPLVSFERWKRFNL